MHANLEQSVRETLVAVGARTRRLRVEANLSQRAVATRAEISIVCLSRFERGMTNTPIHIVDRIARGIGVEMLDLFNTGKDLQAEVIELTRKLPPKRLKALEKRVKALAKQGEGTARKADRPRKT